MPDLFYIIGNVAILKHRPPLAARTDQMARTRPGCQYLIFYILFGFTHGAAEKSSECWVFDLFEGEGCKGAQGQKEKKHVTVSLSQ